MVTNLRAISSFFGTGLVVLALLSSGCGKGSSAANVVSVSLFSSSGTNLILGQSTTLTASVTGATNTNVTWSPCQYTTTTTTNGKTTTSKPVDCPSDGSFGVLSNQEATGTATYTAPDPSKFQLPDQTKFPGLQIVITATSVQDTKKSKSINLTLISGIRVILTPGTASVPTKEVEQFQVQLFNDLQNKSVTWLLTQNVTSSTTPTVAKLPTCSPACGTITPDTNNPNLATYKAPDTVPTAITPAQKGNNNAPQNVTIVAISVADNSAFAAGTITIVQGGPITFNDITPTIAPQGATLWDIYLDAPNISSASLITLTYPNSLQPVVKDSFSGQIKILFPVPPVPSSTTTTTATTLTSTGARLRLNATDLGTSGPVTVAIMDPAEPCNGIAAGNPCTATGASTFNILPVRPTSTASVPDDVVQGKLSQQTRVIIDGGYFGPSGNLATVLFQGNAILQDQNHPSTSRQLDTLLSTNQINAGNPGLYPLSVASTATPAPIPNNSSVTSIAIFPDYSATPPALRPGFAGVPAGTNPSAVDLDPILGVLVVAETGANAVQFYSIGSGALTPIDSTGAPCGTACPVAVGKVPTGLSVNRSNHTVAVVNYQDQSVIVLPIPGAPQQAAGTPFTVDISGALQNSITPAPLPYSIGVDPDSNLALVAYSSTSTSSASNLGFIVNLNPDSPTSPPNECVLDHALNPQSTKMGECLFAQVTLNTGAFPQIAMAPHGHFALVTPGGSGVVRGVDVTKPSSANVILSSTLTAGLVTVTVDTTKCPPGVSPTSSSSTNPCPLLMVPGNAGTVLITGVTPGNTSNNAFFNGTFSVSVTSSNSFTYVVNSTASDSGSGGTVFYGTPDEVFGISATLQGVAINPVTHTAAMADAKATGGINGRPQIDLLNSLDQSVSSISFSAQCTAFVTTCASASEFVGTTDVAWQPYTNSLVSYNPDLNQVSVSDPATRLRYALACASSTACQVNPIVLSQITLSGTGTATLTVQNGTTNSLNLFGGLAVDPATNQAFVVKSGSGSIDIVDLGGPGTATPIKPTHVSEVIVPSPAPAPGAIGGIPNALVPQATLTCAPTSTNTCDLPGVQIFGSGFDSGTQVLLDATSVPAGNVSVNSSRQLTVTIPGSLNVNGVPVFAFPHHYALTVINGSGSQSNAVDFIVIHSVDMSQVCPGAKDANGNPVLPQPTSVAIADQIANGPFSPIALVSVSGCNSVVVLDLNPASSTFGQPIGGPITVGTGPQGIDIWQHRGLAVVANHGTNTASVLDLTQNPPVQKVPDVTVGTTPTGVAIDNATGAAVIANNGSNSVSMINLGLLFPPSGTTPPTTLTASTVGGIQQPLAVAIDPDRGTNNQGIAVVTAVQLNPGTSPTGALAVVEIGLATPALSTTISSGFVTGTPTGIVFDPAVATGTANPGVFFANSSGANVITEFNPDTGGGPSVNVGINPTSLAVNSQTGAILTSNSASNTVSIVDTLSNPFKTHQTLGIPGSPTFGVAIDPFTNLAVIVDQANNRVLLFPMPN